MAENINNFPAPAFGGIPNGVPTVATPAAAPVAFPTGNAGIAAVSDGAVIIGYVAPQKNVLKRVSLNTTEARKSWINNRSTAWETPIEYTNSKGEQKTVSYSPAFKETVFKAYMQRYNKAEYDRVLSIPAYKADTSEARVDRYVVKVAPGSAALNNLSKVAASTTNAVKGIAVLTAQDLVEYFSQAGSQMIPISIMRRNANGEVVVDASGKEDMINIGDVALEATEITATSKGEKVKKKAIVVRIYDKDGKRKSIRDLSIFGNNSENAKVPYAVLRNMTEASDFGNINPEHILNAERFGKLFPDQDPATLPKRITISKKDFTEKKDYEAAKVAQILDHESSGAAKLGIDDDVWARLSQAKSSKGGKTYSVEEIAQTTQAALSLLRTNSDVRIKG